MVGGLLPANTADMVVFREDDDTIMELGENQSSLKKHWKFSASLKRNELKNGNTDYSIENPLNLVSSP